MDNLINEFSGLLLLFQVLIILHFILFLISIFFICKNNKENNLTTTLLSFIISFFIPIIGSIIIIFNLKYNKKYLLFISLFFLISCNKENTLSDIEKLDTEYKLIKEFGVTKQLSDNNSNEIVSFKNLEEFKNYYDSILKPVFEDYSNYSLNKNIKSVSTEHQDFSRVINNKSLKYEGEMFYVRTFNGRDYYNMIFKSKSFGMGNKLVIMFLDMSKENGRWRVTRGKDNVTMFIDGFLPLVKFEIYRAIIRNNSYSITGNYKFKIEGFPDVYQKTFNMNNRWGIKDGVPYIN